MKLWGGRFTQSTHNAVDTYNASIGFDHVLAEFDIQGSIAHATMLGQCKILDVASVTSIVSGLQEILHDFREGKLEFKIADEDIHMNIERILHARIGDAALKLHTGRSRNDQVTLDLHLYVRAQILICVEKLKQLIQVLVHLATKHEDVLMPGYTHLQRAEPIRFSHYVLAYVNMFFRDLQRFQDSFSRVNVSPLGAGALAGSGVPVDCEYSAELLHFDAVYANSLDAVSDRDFIAEFLFNASLVMMHFSKFSEELILWSNQEFAFIDLGDQFCTGSSMMPQKKNPDIPELARGKVGRVYGALIGILTVLKGLPLAYNKDLQEDKEGLFDAVNTLQQTLTIYTLMLDSLQIKEKNMQNAVREDYANATQLANYLTLKSIPFREAHKITGEIVLFGLTQQKYLLELSLDELHKFCPLIEKDIYDWLQPEAVVEAHTAKGGTSKASVNFQIQETYQKLDEVAVWIQLHKF